MLRLVVCVLLLPVTAVAGEVVWFGEPEPSDRLTVSAEALPSGPELDLMDLATAASRFRPSDRRTLDDLEAALEEVRPYEARLDGELVIMRDLARPIEGVTVLRNEGDRDVLFKALAYQGFAVDRYFLQSLADDPEAEPFRVMVDGAPLERPWVDANALDPERSITAYDIAEAPQRVAYGQVQQEVSRTLPSSLVPEGLQDGDLFRVDGVAREVGPTGGVRLPMGRHFAHVERDDTIIERWVVRLEPGDEQVLTVSDPMGEARAWADALWAGDDPMMPERIRAGVQALGGDVWLARPGRSGVEVIRIDGDTVERRVLRPVATARAKDDGFSGYVAANLGWLSSGNFSLDKPNASFTRSEVNALFVGAGVGVAYDAGIYRFGVGLQWGLTPGLDHVAEWNSGSTHMRLYPHVAVGIKPLQLTAGYVMPMHPTVGLRSEIPLVAGLEVHATGWLGFGGKLSRGQFEDYDLKPLYAATVGVGYRFGK